jgi:RNA polymerase sigma-70 factor (ECF subfamily)
MLHRKYAILLIRRACCMRPALTQAAGTAQVRAEEFHDSIRPGLVAMLPRLKRFADLLVGERKRGTALLGRALARMLIEQHRYQRGTALDLWAFAEIYRHWLDELRSHADPMAHAHADEPSFATLFCGDGGEEIDAFTAPFLRSLPPQQRMTLLLVYAERFDHIDAGRVLDVSAETIATRLVRLTADFADRLHAYAEPANDAVYAEGEAA